MKRILLCSDRGALVYEWRSGRFGGNRTFDADEEGLRDFEDYVAKLNASVPIYILVDVTEEEFHPTSAPYVVGRDRKAVLARAVNKYFRHTAFKHVVHQGREDFGRKDIKLLTSGVVEDKVLTVWIQRLQRAKVPIVGIFSMPLIGESLLGALGYMQKRVLLVSQQSNGTLRQSFYDQGKLRLSRLAYHQTDKELLDPEQIIQDIDNTWLYLKGQRAVGRNELVDICIVGTQSLVTRLEQSQISERFQHCTVIPQQQLASRVGIKSELPSPYADGIFAHLLCKGKIKNHYAPPSVRTHHHHRLLAKFMYGFSALAFFGAGAMAANNYYTTLSLERYTTQARLERLRVQLLKSEYLRDSDLGIAPELVRSAVTSTETLQLMTEPSLQALFVALGQVMNRHPQIQIDHLQWTIDNEQKAGIGEFQPRSRSELLKAERSAGNPEVSPWLEQIIIRGRVLEQDGAYRKSLAHFDEFVADLERSGAFTQVLRIESPYSLNQQQTFQGLAQNQGEGLEAGLRAQFSIAVAREMHYGQE